MPRWCRYRAGPRRTGALEERESRGREAPFRWPLGGGGGGGCSFALKNPSAKGCARKKNDRRPRVRPGTRVQDRPDLKPRRQEPSITADFQASGCVDSSGDSSGDKASTAGTAGTEKRRRTFIHSLFSICTCIGFACFFQLVSWWSSCCADWPLPAWWSHAAADAGINLLAGRQRAAGGAGKSLAKRPRIPIACRHSQSREMDRGGHRRL